MKVLRQIVLSLGLLGLGWTLGYAQRAEPEFMIQIDAPVGDTTVECLSGCELMGARDVGNSRAGRMKTYRYRCGGESIQRCSGRAAGWLIKS
ncbi:MAG TPA: hypothetical protein VFO36_01760 [Nitrospiraceae bacterium]|nr:hypothetical protein [Nitrospiraceae bacterium]